MRQGFTGEVWECTSHGEMRAHTMHPISLTPSAVRHFRRLTLVVSARGGGVPLWRRPKPGVGQQLRRQDHQRRPARKAAKQDPNRGTLSVAARRAIHRGYLVPNQARYDRQKARSTRRAESREALTAPVSGPLAPSIISGRSWQGINSTNVTPPDETSAVGTTRYIELVNVKFAIYNKTSNSPISTGRINSLVGASSTDDVFDVQIIWDPTTSRFYYAADDVVSSSNNRLAFGFSKTASPSSAADFCKYSAGFGANFPDYPKLGDSQFFVMIGSNVFSGGGSFLGSDLLAISKPPAGASCPAASTFKADERLP